MSMQAPLSHIPDAQSMVTNVGLRLTATAARNPDGVAVAEALRGKRSGRRRYRQVTFGELDQDSSRIASGLVARGVTPGTRLALMVRPGVDFIALVFALFKAGAVAVLIDPGMGRRNLIRCLEEAQPDGFVALPAVHAARVFLRRRFPQARHNVTVGRRWFWGGETLEQLRRESHPPLTPAPTRADDPAAIIFTTGSTGPPKGVLYCHGNFERQTDAIRDFYGIQPGEIDIAAFPLFALFNAPMGVTTVIPHMDFTRPSQADPGNIVEAIQDWQATQAFGSPALWNVVGRHCQQRGVRLTSLRRVLSAGAPVPLHVLQRMKEAIHPDGEVHTPYGATEALPVASIGAAEVLAETASRSREGAGTCVGRRFPGIEWRVIRISDEPIERGQDAEPLPRGEIGELMVRGPVVTRRYVTRCEANAHHKVPDGETFWHRMGDVGYLDEQDRFWFCGRKSHRVLTPQGPLYTIPCEAILNQHPRVYRSALVGVGEAGKQRPVLIAELWPEHRPRSATDRAELVGQLRQLAKQYPLTRCIDDVLIHPAMPVDIRHNAKIFREQLAAWAAVQLQAGAVAK